MSTMLERTDPEFIDYAPTERSIDYVPNKVEPSQFEKERLADDVIADLQRETMTAYEASENNFDLENAEPTYREVDAAFINENISRGLLIEEIRASDLLRNPGKYPTSNQDYMTQLVNKVRSGFYLPRTTKDQIDQEAVTIGRQVFDKRMLPNNVELMFFCKDDKNWFAIYELKATDQNKVVTLHYELLPSGILKCSSQGAPAIFITGKEAADFDAATQRYLGLVSDLYNCNVYSSKKAA